jgi:hypothetical protein
MFWLSTRAAVFLRAASRDVSRSDPELDAALHLKQRKEFPIAGGEGIFYVPPIARRP